MSELRNGTYWDAVRQRYVHPEDPSWSIVGYERATGIRWNEEPDWKTAEELGHELTAEQKAAKAASELSETD